MSNIGTYTIDDIPPAIFPDGAIEVDMGSPSAFQSDQSIEPTLSDGHAVGPVYRAVRIARACDGSTELRLLERVGASKPHERFELADVTLWPYRQQRGPVPGIKKTHTEAKTIAAFDRLVDDRYPKQKLRNGTLVPIHTELLKG
jgi:hypothetical protein